MDPIKKFTQVVSSVLVIATLVLSPISPLLAQEVADIPNETAPAKEELNKQSENLVEEEPVAEKPSVAEVTEEDKKELSDDDGAADTTTTTTQDDGEGDSDMNSSPLGDLGKKVQQDIAEPLMRGAPFSPQNFTTLVAPAPIITKIDAYFVKSSYKGIGVDIHVDNLTDATHVEVEVVRDNGASVVKTNKSTGSVLGILNTGNPAFVTAPIVIETVTYDEVGSSSWNIPTATWDHTNTPTKIIVRIKRGTETDLVEETTLISTPFATLSEVMPANPDPTGASSLNLSGYIYRDHKLDDCTNKGTCEDKAENLGAGWEINLYKEVAPGDWESVNSVQTNTEGNFKFPTISEAGTYHVCEELNEGWTQQKQTWSGSGYLVATDNLSDNENEGPYCKTITYQDIADRSSKFKFGNVDTTKPVTEVVSPDSGLSYRSDALPVIAVHSEDAQSGIVLTVVNLYTTPNTLIKSCVNTTVAATGEIDFSCDLSLHADVLPEGDYFIKTNTRDAGGNTSNTVAWNFTVDNTAPTAPSITKPTARQWFKSSPIKTQWTASTDNDEIKEYQVAYSFDDGHAFGGSTCTDLATIEGKNIGGCRNSDSTSRNHNPSDSAQGGVAIWVRAIDNAGNMSPWSSSVHYYYDNTAPTTDINVSSVVNGEFTVSGDASDNLSLNRVYVQLVNRQTNSRVGGQTINLIGSGTNSSWTANYAGLPDGDYAAHVSVTDMAGNSSTAGWTSNFNVTTDTGTPTTKTPSTFVVEGDTSSAENELGWLFNRDTDTATPFEFNEEESVIGDGSLYVLPIGNTNKDDKFIAEYFPQTRISELSSFSVDYKMGENSEANDYKQVYLSIYANFGQSADDKFYDCRYSVTATTGSENDFTTLTFDPTQSYPVKKRGDSPFACPAIPADMDTLSSESNIRAIAINLGDTSFEDADVHAYFDKAVIETDDEIITYDFELAPAPIVIAPAFVEEDTSSRRGRSGGSRIGFTFPTSQGEVLGATTGLGDACGVTLSTYMREGFQNIPSEVMLLQTFLTAQGFPVPSTGFFGPITKAAVIQFQNKFAEEILKPWNVEANGYVYKTTRWKINNLICDGSEEYPMIP